jgi:RND family efflux transporter MFP subunit
MATQRAPVPVPSTEFLAALLAEREIVPRAKLIAQACAELAPGSGVVVYLFADQEGRWLRKATLGEVTAESAVRAGAGTLGMLAQRRQPLLLQGNVAREDYAHLAVRRTVLSLACVPIERKGALVGAVEVVSFDQALTEQDVNLLKQLCDYAAPALATAAAYEDERNSQLTSITRITQLYDLEKVFNSTLDMDKLLPIVPQKIREILPVAAVNLWLVSDNDMLLMTRDGVDPSVEVGTAQKSGEGIAAEVGDSGRPLLAGPGDARLVRRNAGGTAVTAVLAVPILERGSLVGVLEAVNKEGGQRFDEDDLFFLSSMAETAASALHNASLLEAERKIEILETLVEVSNEITSTLNLERVLKVVVNNPQRILRYDRAAVALEERNKFVVKAVSGMTELVAGDPKVRELREMLEWAAASNEPVYVTMHGKQVDAERPETRARFQTYFTATGMRGWYSAPLSDDQGRLGMISFESANPDFLTAAHLEFLKVVAAQATVALRNASLYAEVPLIGVLEPLLHKKHQFMRMEKRRRASMVVLAAAVVLFLVFFPLPMRVEGTAAVAPQRSAQIATQMDGVVRAVHVREGDPVKQGTILAELDDWEYRSALAGAEAKRDAALADMNRALASNDGAQAGVRKVDAEYWASEVQRARARLEQTRLRSPIDGVVATPYVENLAGRKLLAGETFAQVVDASHASVDVAVEQEDVALMAAGQPAAVKLESFPTRKFTGQVTLLSPVSAAEGEKRVFFARVDVPNPDGLIRAGMQGKAKVSTGWRPAGYVLFRGLGMWAWTKLWSWFGG